MDAKNNLLQHNGYLQRQWVRGSSHRVLGHVLEDNSDLPLLEPEGPFRKQAQYRHKCRMAAIEVEANTKISKSLIGRSRLKRGGYDVGVERRSRSPSVARTLDGTPQES